MTTTVFAHVASEANLTVYAAAEQITIPSDSPDYGRALELIDQGRMAEAFAIAQSYRAEAQKAQAALKMMHGAAATVEIVHGQLLVNGVATSGVATDKILSFAKRKLPVKAMMAFVARLQKNPSYRAREDMFAWIDANNMPITPDGCFLAFKIVREDYWDIYTGSTFLHTVGSVIEMPREQVDDNPNNTCSAGAHFCGEGYLPYYGTGVGNRIVVLKIAPEDVVAFPYDYNLAKGRAYKYEVIDEMSRESVQKYIGTLNRNYTGPSEDYDDEYDDEYDESF